MEKSDRLPRVECPVVLSAPLRTQSLRAVLPRVDCIRICRPSDRFWHWLDYETLALEGGRATLLCGERDVAQFLNTRTALSPISQEEAERVLFAFAELCGYQILTERPDIPDWVRNHGEKRREAERLDWTTSWATCEGGWEVSCVMVTTHENLSCSRYTILIGENGTIQILKKDEHFFTHCIL